MASLPWDCLGLVLPFADNATLRSLSQTCKQIELMTRQQVKTVRLAERGAVRELWDARLWAAASSGRVGAAFHLCQTLEVELHEHEDATHLQTVLRIASGGWHRLHTLRLLGADTLLHPVYLLPPLTPLPSTLSSLAVQFPVTADDTSLEALGSMTQLTSLHLQLARGPHVLQFFGRLTQLQQLHMCAWVDDASNAWLPSSLQELTIAVTEAGRCGSAWMDALQACSALRSLTLLELGWQDVADDTIDLAPCTQLTRVDGNIDASAVFANLPASLIVLQLTIGEGRGGVYPATPACRVSEDLPEGLAACTALEVLHLMRCGLLPPLPSLRSASLGVWAHEYNVAVVHSVLLTIPSNITSLDFAPCHCQDVSIQGLSHCTALRELSLDGGGAGFILDFEHLRPLTALTKLVLYDTSESALQTPYHQPFTLLHEEKLQFLPLQQLYVPGWLWEYVRGSAPQRCNVIAL